MVYIETMTFASAVMVSVVQPILNTSVSVAANQLATPNTNPGYNSTFALGVNSGPSTSLAIPTQGVNGNPVGRPGDEIPEMICNLQNTILQQAAYLYRI